MSETPAARGFNTPTLDLPGWKHVYSGKVRDLYVPPTIPSSKDGPGMRAGGGQRPHQRLRPRPGSEIPDKGRILTQLSLWWFDQLDVEHHVLASTVADGVPAAVEGRAMICKKLDMFPVECIARGYLTGSGLARNTGCPAPCASIPLPEGLVDGSRLEHAIFTPSAKAEWASTTEHHL
jgi:phosphoribosylaminoimidazole-succinocarboxamide synthase